MKALPEDDRAGTGIADILQRMIMKKLLIIFVVALTGLSAYSQQNILVSNLLTQEPSTEPEYSMGLSYSAQPIDSNTVFKHLRDGLVMQGGQLKVIRNGYAFKMRGPFPLKNGTILFTDGIIKMPDGSTPILDDRSYMDFDGHIKPLQ